MNKEWWHHSRWIRVVDLFTFSHGGNRNKQGGRVTLMWLAALSSGLAVLWCGCAVLWCGHAVFWWFLLGLKTNKKKQAKMNDWKHLWCWCLGAAWPNACVYLTSSGHGEGQSLCSITQWAWLMTEVRRSATTLPR